jgi:hypothetical protein
MQDILEGLDSIDWPNLSHAYGEASDVPVMVKALLSDDVDERYDAFFQLLGNIWHQGTVHEASAYVVPFLIKMLSSPITPDRARIALILASLADGQSYLEVHALQDEESQLTWRKILSDEGKDFNRQLERERSWVRATREAIEPNLVLLYEFLDHEEPELRLAVATALANFPELASESIGILENAVDSESEGYVREEMLSSIAKLNMESLLGTNNLIDLNNASVSD